MARGRRAAPARLLLLIVLFVRRAAHPRAVAGAARCAVGATHLAAAATAIADDAASQSDVHYEQ